MTRLETQMVNKLQQRIAELEQMQREYNAFLNYVVMVKGDIIENEEVFIVHTDKMKRIPLLTIRSEIVDNGKRMELRRVDLTKNGDKPTIIVS